jgi:hypothetical protein
MGQVSMTILVVAGSGLSGNQQAMHSGVIVSEIADRIDIEDR